VDGKDADPSTVVGPVESVGNFNGFSDEDDVYWFDSNPGPSFPDLGEDAVSGVDHLIEEREKERLEDQLRDIEDSLKDRDVICESVVFELDEEIRRQKNRLERAQSSDEPRIRAILKELYRERREEHRSKCQDKQSWLERKVELDTLHGTPLFNGS
jgi:hypothetical protein